MANSPRTRHSKDRGEPVTIDLAADAVSETPEEAATPESGDTPVASDGGPSEPPPANEPPETAEETPAAGPAAGAGPFAPPPASTSPAARRGVGSLLAAGVVGGLVATGGNVAWSFLNPPAQPPSIDFAAEMKARDDGIAALSGALDGLKGEIEALKGGLAAVQPGEAPDMAPLAARIEALEKQFAGLAQAGGDPADAAKFAAIEAKLAEIGAGVTAAGDAARMAGETAAGQASRIEALAAAVKAVEEKAAASAGNPKIALAIAAAALKSAVDRGQPFMTELETYAAVSPQAPEIAALRAFAATGVPSRADLAGAAGPAAEAMVAAMNVAAPDAGFFERLWESAKALVSVRPIGMVEGESVEAIAARMEAKVKAGDLKGALEELGKAPEPAKAAAAEFATRVQGRLTVEDLIDKALAAALASGNSGG